jgi:hypothetical protein
MTTNIRTAADVDTEDDYLPPWDDYIDPATGQLVIGIKHGYSKEYLDWHEEFIARGKRIVAEEQPRRAKNR